MCFSEASKAADGWRMNEFGELYWGAFSLDYDLLQLPYARYYNPLLIRNRSWILTIHKARILRKKLLKKLFLDFKKWVKNMQTAGYNGARTVFILVLANFICWYKKKNPTVEK